MLRTSANWMGPNSMPYYSHYRMLPSKFYHVNVLEMFSKIVLKNPRMFSNLMCCLLYEPWVYKVYVMKYIVCNFVAPKIKMIVKLNLLWSEIGSNGDVSAYCYGHWSHIGLWLDLDIGRRLWLARFYRHWSRIGLWLDLDIGRRLWLARFYRHWSRIGLWLDLDIGRRLWLARFYRYWSRIGLWLDLDTRRSMSNIKAVSREHWPMTWHRYWVKDSSKQRAWEAQTHSQADHLHQTTGPHHE